MFPSIHLQKNVLNMLYSMSLGHSSFFRHVVQSIMRPSLSLPSVICLKWIVPLIGSTGVWRRPGRGAPLSWRSTDSGRSSQGTIMLWTWSQTWNWWGIFQSKSPTSSSPLRVPPEPGPMPACQYQHDSLAFYLTFVYSGIGYTLVIHDHKYELYC